MAGRPPKRASSRAGHSPVPITVVKVSGRVEWPEPDSGWHPIVKQWYRGLQGPELEGIRAQSDASSAYVWAEYLHRILMATRPSGQAFAVFRQAEAALGVTEGDRRRQRLELERFAPPDPGPDVAALKSRFGFTE
jgi:hypothetical protein